MSDMDKAIKHLSEEALAIAGKAEHKKSILDGCPPFHKKVLETCLGVETPKPKIDLDLPIQSVSVPSQHVRLLTKQINLDGCNAALISVGHDRLELEGLYLLDPVTGTGRGVRTNCTEEFQNIPEIKESVQYINYYGNGRASEDVFESFDTLDDADQSNIFYSRDCCIRLVVKNTDGVFSASAEVMFQ
jgi:hypothetical protein